MKVYLSGWSRNHGRRTVIDDDLTNCRVTEGGLIAYSFAKGVLHAETNSESRVVSITYSRGVQITANGDYLFQMRFTARDISLLAFIYMKELSMNKIANIFGEFSERERDMDLSKRILRNGYSGKLPVLRRLLGSAPAITNQSHLRATVK